MWWPDHVERPQRLTSILSHLKAAFPTLNPVPAPLATREQLLLFHTPQHVNKVGRRRKAAWTVRRAAAREFSRILSSMAAFRVQLIRIFDM